MPPARRRRFFSWLARPLFFAVEGIGGVALNQIKNDPGQSGRGRAIAGLVLGAVALVLIVFVLILGETEFTFE